MPLVRLETQRLTLFDSGGVEPHMVADFASRNRHFFEPWSAKVGDEYYTPGFWEKKLSKNQALEAEGVQFTFFVCLKEDLSEIVA